MSTPEFTVRKKNINSKRLFREIDAFVQDGIEGISKANRSGDNITYILEMIEQWLQTFVEADRISRFKVVKRIKNKNLQVYVSYTQRHCLNTTSIEYEIINMMGEKPRQSTLYLTLTP